MPKRRQKIARLWVGKGLSQRQGERVAKEFRKGFPLKLKRKRKREGKTFAKIRSKKMTKKEIQKELEKEIFQCELNIRNYEYYLEKEKDLNFEINLQIYRTMYYKNGLKFALQLFSKNA